MSNNSLEAVVEQITRARISLLLKHPFWGTLATRLQLKDITDEPWCNTAAVDYRNLYFDRNFFSKLDKDETIFVIAHEVQHIVYDHMGRRGGRLPKLWNAAADYVINLELHENKIGRIPDNKTSGIQALYDEKYKGMFAEEVYELLLKDPNKNFPEFDVHLEPGDGKGEGMTEEERRVMSDELRAAIIEAAKAVTNNGGTVPAGVKRMLKDLIEPQMDWREIINMRLQSMFKSDFTWSRCSRKAQASGFYLPGLKDDFRAEAAISIDCSGSMADDMLRDLLSEVKGIMEQFLDFKLHVWCFDTKTYNYAIFTPENLDDIDSYQIKGGGGTDFMCNWDYMRKIDLQPEQLIVMTDGYPCGEWGEENYCDTVFLIHGDTKQQIVAPFGMTTYYTPRN